MSANGTLLNGAVARPFKSLEQIENDQIAADNRAARRPTVADKLRMALNDHRRQSQALETVLSVCHGANVLPTQLVGRKVSELIEKSLLQRVVYITRDSIDDQRRVVEPGEDGA